MTMKDVQEELKAHENILNDNDAFQNPQLFNRDIQEGFSCVSYVSQFNSVQDL